MSHSENFCDEKDVVYGLDGSALNQVFSSGDARLNFGFDLFLIQILIVVYFTFGKKTLIVINKSFNIKIYLDLQRVNNITITPKIIE